MNTNVKQNGNNNYLATATTLKQQQHILRDFTIKICQYFNGSKNMLFLIEKLKLNQVNSFLGQDILI